MNKIQVIITEGAQDAAFIYKVLIENSYKDFSSKFGELISPIKEIILEHVKEKYPDNLGVKYKRMLFLPHILQSENKQSYILIYALQGVEDYRGFNSILWKYLTATARNENILLSFLIVFDADASVQNRINIIKNKNSEIQEQYKKKKKKIINNEMNINPTIKLNLENIEHNKITYISIEYSVNPTNNKNIKFGFYFLPGYEPNNGTLDYLTLPLMKENKQDLFKKTEVFIKQNNTKFSEIETITEKEKKVTETASYYKTVIGIAGQFDNNLKGSSNTVFYQNGLYLDAKLKENQQCKEIVKLINSLFE